jgi:hypothetical protein
MGYTMTSYRSSRAIDIEKATLNPSSVFRTPEDVLTNVALTSDQKVEILRRWEYDAAEVSVAVEEGMPGDDDDAGLLRRILLALDELTGGIDTERSGPSKQHGLDRLAVKRRR